MFFRYFVFQFDILLPDFHICFNFFFCTCIGASFGALSAGRVTIIAICLSYLSKAVPIAIRYSAARKQFGPEGGNECSVLEYQLQVRIFKDSYALKLRISGHP